MSCPYGDDELQEWDGVANPMGVECNNCYECECEHWVGCHDDCDTEDRMNHDCRMWQPELDPYREGY